VKRLLLLAACAILALPAAAQGPYLGGSFGRSTFTDWCDVSGSCEDTDTAWKLFGGYRVNRHFGIEATYVDWGEVTASTGSVDVAASQYSYGLAAVGTLPLGDRGFELFGKLGILLTSQETRRVQPNPSTVNRDETELHYGLGARYGINQSLAVRAEWENTEKLKVQMLSIGVEYRF
jgi:OmpA-OmpF porin, OOP family